MAVTVPTPIDALSTPPSTSDPTNFDTRADTFLGELPDFATQSNALANVNYSNALDAASNATSAATSASIATTQANLAAASAASVTAAMFIGTSSTNNTIAITTLTFTINEVSRAWGVGTSLTAASTASPTNSVVGVVTAYTSNTLTLAVSSVSGSGTFSAWTITPQGSVAPSTTPRQVLQFAKLSFLGS